METEGGELEKIIMKSIPFLGCPLEAIREVGDRKDLAILAPSPKLQDALFALENRFSDSLIQLTAWR